MALENACGVIAFNGLELSDLVVHQVKTDHDLRALQYSVTLKKLNDPILNNLQYHTIQNHHSLRMNCQSRQRKTPYHLPLFPVATWQLMLQEKSLVWTAWHAVHVTRKFYTVSQRTTLTTNAIDNTTDLWIFMS